MRDWIRVLRFLHDNITLILFVFVLALVGTTWIVMEAFRSHRSRDEIFKLRKRLSELERERSAGPRAMSDPFVLTNRWVRIGGAATTTDGGCLIYIDKVAPAAGTAALTVRIDGNAVFQNHSLRVGERMEASGKYGTYILELYGVEGIQANVAIALRNRHADVQEAERGPEPGMR